MDWAWAPSFMVNVAEPLAAARLRTLEADFMMMLNRHGDDVDSLPWRDLVVELQAVAVRTWNWRPGGGPTIPVDVARPTVDDVAAQYDVEL